MQHETPSKDAAQVPPTSLCRLCYAPATHQFQHTILARHRADYFACTGCGSLQTTLPHWLDEAYGFGGSTLDVGTALRPLQNWLLLATAFTACGLPRTARYLDFGGNTGLFTQLMRYSGYNFACFDRFVKPFFADYHHVRELGDTPSDVITAFEVFEHFSEPRRELDALFATRPALVISSTQLWQNQGPDWDYLAPACGQHVFFYTEAALQNVAARHGYALIVGRHFQFFARNADRPAAIDKLLSCLPQAEISDPDIVSVVGSVVRFNDYIAQDSAQAVERFSRELTSRAEPSLREMAEEVQRAVRPMIRLLAKKVACRVQKQPFFCKKN